MKQLFFTEPKRIIDPKAYITQVTHWCWARRTPEFSLTAKEVDNPVAHRESTFLCKPSPVTPTAISKGLPSCRVKLCSITQNQASISLRSLSHRLPGIAKVTPCLTVRWSPTLACHQSNLYCSSG